MIGSLTLLLACQLAGEIASRALVLPVPGPVLGLVILFLGLQLFARRRNLTGADIERSDLGRTAQSLLQALALLFVPAGAGVIQHLGVLGEHGLVLLVALFGSTLITLLATVAVFIGVKRLQAGEEASS
jgi:putative effector of murein hydrolase LrgA (UPF0299 family)